MPEEAAKQLVQKLREEKRNLNLEAVGLTKTSTVLFGNPGSKIQTESVTLGLKYAKRIARERKVGYTVNHTQTGVCYITFQENKTTEMKKNDRRNC